MFSKIGELDRMFGAMDLLRNKMDRLFGDIDKSFYYTPGVSNRTTGPCTNLYEDGDNFKIRAEVPGFTKNDLNISIQGNYLEISGTRPVDRPEGYRIHRTERNSGTFSRSFTLPGDTITDKVQATLKDGILYLTLPKSEAAKPKQITVK